MLYRTEQQCENKTKNLEINPECTENNCVQITQKSRKHIIPNRNTMRAQN